MQTCLHKHRQATGQRAAHPVIMGRTHQAPTARHHTLLGLGGDNAARRKFLLFGLCGALVVVVQIMLTKVRLAR